jgi:hypothetical protein
MKRLLVTGFLFLLICPVYGEQRLYDESFARLDSLLVGGDLTGLETTIEMKLDSGWSSLEQAFYTRALDRYLTAVDRIRSVDRLDIHKVKDNLGYIVASLDENRVWDVYPLDTAKQNLFKNSDQDQYKEAYQSYLVYRFFLHKYEFEVDLLLDQARSAFGETQLDLSDRIVMAVERDYLSPLPGALFSNDLIVKYETTRETIDKSKAKRAFVNEFKTRTRFEKTFSVQLGFSGNRLGARNTVHETPYDGPNPNFASMITYQTATTQSFNPGVTVALQYEPVRKVGVGIQLTYSRVRYEKITVEIEQDFTDDRQPPVYTFENEYTNVEFNSAMMNLYVTYLLRDKIGLRPFLQAGVEQYYLVHDTTVEPKMHYMPWVADQLNFDQKTVTHASVSMGLEYVPDHDSRLTYAGLIRFSRNASDLLYFQEWVFGLDLGIRFYMF